MREAQFKSLALPKTGLASAVDIGDVKNIHPVNKQEVGRRLFQAAQVIAYGEKGAPSGPHYSKHEIQDSTIVIHFDNAESGLKAKGGELKGFAMAGADKKWHWGQAKIQGGAVVVSAESVKTPSAVRYGWANNPIGNLINAEGLPAAPFRTDDWPLGK